MTWPDILIATGQVLLSLLLLPTILDSEAYVPRRTSIPTAMVLTSFLPAFHALGAPVSVIGTSLAVIGWWLIALMRGGSR